MKAKAKKPPKRSTKALYVFEDILWKIEKLVELGVVGIDKELDDGPRKFLAELDHVKGSRGPRPKSYKPEIESIRDKDGEVVSLVVDKRTAFTMKKSLEWDVKRHEDLRYFLNGSLAIILWGAFETYNELVFEQVLRQKPEILCSNEKVDVKDVIENKDSILDFLIERQLVNLGHSGLDETISYYQKRLGINISTSQANQLAKYYEVRNLLAHKTGIVRKGQKLKFSTDFSIVGDEVRISKSFLNKMTKDIERVTRNIEAKVVSKFLMPT